ncbi:carotenoid ester lipase precursor [Lenzites betulinus]|nr:carotenoid ester lipase precursor [Lenzites betulinus]
MARLLQYLLYWTPFAYAAPTTVTLDTATVFGTSDGYTDQYLGIPFAQPPVGNLRLRLPQPVTPYVGLINATTSGNQCHQQVLPAPPVPSGASPELQEFITLILASQGTGPPQSEDCLNINIIVPTGSKPGDELPVAAWIYGGAFQVGSNVLEPGAAIVNRSVELGQPVIFVSMNYRLSAFGFLGGREVEESGLGNLGLQDQQEALRWIQKYISAFGGDPAKVTIFGESAGAISVAHQMLANGGHTEGLFRGAWMESGSVFPGGDISKTQSTFDTIVSEVGCESATDALECLRSVPASDIVAAMNKTPTIFSFEALNLPWMPRVDGVFLTGSSMELTKKGAIANVPFVIGTNEDEGTLFALASTNITTEAELAGYIKSNYFPDASNTTIAQLLQLYPADPAAGSPFGTGDEFAFTPEYKRIAAITGDLIFGGTRRFLLRERSGQQIARSYQSQRSKIPGLGAAHSTELGNIFGPGDMTDYLVRFVNTLDPNGGSEIEWPVYTTESPQLLAFVDGDTPLKIIPDTFREEAIAFLTHLIFEQPF